MGFLKKLFNSSGDPSDNISIYSPVEGDVVDVSEVNDPTFKDGILGKGIAIVPTGDTVSAPCDATVTLIFETGHAISLLSDSGVEILIHIGLDTVNLKGKHFKKHVHNGDKISKGQLLIEFEREELIKDGYDVITPVVICNSSEYKDIKCHTGSHVIVGNEILTVVK